MLPKTHRITTELFQKIMKEGAFVSGNLFTLRYIYQSKPQYACVAPKSFAKSAVLRNSLRRQGYSALRSIKGSIPASSTIRKQIAGIFFYKKQTKRPAFQEIKADITLILHKVL